MRLINSNGFKDGALFQYLPAEQVHPHDHFLDRALLRFFPSRITPNQITMVRIILTPIVIFVILYGNYKLGIILFLLAAFTDALDGSLARTRNRVTRFGMMADPFADKFLIGSMVFLLVFRYFNIYLGIAVLGIEIILIVTAWISKVKFKTIRMANGWGKIKMILQVLAVFLTLMALLFEFPLLLTIAAWMFGIAVGFAVVSLFYQGI